MSTWPGPTAPETRCVMSTVYWVAGHALTNVEVHYLVGLYGVAIQVFNENSQHILFPCGNSSIKGSLNQVRLPFSYLQLME